MTRTYPYNNTTIKHVFEQLKNFKNQGNTKDYEVRIDDLTVVQRTNNINNFHLFKKSLTNFSKAIRILLYKGNSRKYDQYVLNRKIENKQIPDLAPEEYLQRKLDEWISKEKKEIHFARLKEENKQLKKQLKKIEAKNRELQAKKSIDLDGIMKFATQLPQLINNQSKPDQTLPTELNGIPMTDLLQMINGYRKSWGRRSISTCIRYNNNVRK